jgi:hypothetical protein
MHSLDYDTSIDDYCRQIEMIMADLGYEPPRDAEMPEQWLPKVLHAFLDLQKRVSGL